MPFINVKTNIPVSENAQEALKTRLGQAIEAIPGKSEAWLMVGVEPECALWFQGTDAPACTSAPRRPPPPPRWWRYPFTAARSRTPTMH